MQIYFGAVAADEVFDTDSMFVSEQDNDNYFYYGVEYGSNPGGTEEIMIYDGIGREVPIDMASVPALIEALSTYLEIHETMLPFERLRDVVFSTDETATIPPI
jgi:hypothetical protein